jgi:hypothetical protein
MADRTVIHEAILQIRAETTQLRADLQQGKVAFEGTLRQMQGFARSFAGALGASLSVGALVSYGKQIIDLGGQLKDLSEQTGISASTLSGLKSTIEENGSSLEQFATGITFAQKTLGKLDEEGKGAGEALKRLGLDLREMQQASPEEFLEKLAKALAQIENPMLRNALGAQLLGKSFAQLSPALNAVAKDFDNLKRSGLTEEQVKVLDDLGDAATRAGNQLLFFGANVITQFLQRLHVMPREIGQVLQELKEIETGAVTTGSVIQSILSHSPFVNVFVETTAERIKNLREELAKLQAGAAVLGGAQALAPPKKPADFGTGTGTDKAKSAVDSFIASLQKQIAALRVQQFEMERGEGASLKLSQAYDVLALKADIVANKKVVPKEVEAEAQKAILFLESLGLTVGEVNDKNLANLQASVQGLSASLIASKANAEAMAKSIEKLETMFPEPLVPGSQGESEELAKLPPRERAKRGIAVTPEESKQLDAQTEEVAARARAMEREITLATVDESRKRLLEIQYEYEGRIAEINKWKEEAKAAGIDVAEAEATAARLAEGAWAAKIQKQKEQTEELTEFTRRAFERAFDTVTNLLRDLSNGQIKSWKDLGMRVKGVIDEITAEWLTLQLKTAVLGPDFGKQGGKVGGLAGQFEEWLGGLFGGGKPPLSERVPGGELPDEGGSLEDMQKVWEAASQTQSAAAVTAIETTGATAGTSIQATAATAQAGLQAELATAQAGIQAGVSTGTAAIQAVQATAIAAIQAQQAAGAASVGGASPFAIDLGLFGGGGGGGAADILTGEFEGGGGILGGLPLDLGLFHEGGVVGKSLATGDNLKSDLKPNERLAVLELDERVLTKEQNRDYERTLEVRKFHEGGMVSDLVVDDRMSAITIEGASTMASRDLDHAPRAHTREDSKMRAQRPIINNFNFPREHTDFRSLERHRGQIAGILRREITKASREE